MEDPDEFREAVRIRLGASGPGSGRRYICECCGEAPLDGAGEHASKCCVGEATKRHHKVTQLLHGYVKIVDPDADTEVPDLVASNVNLRPADLLTAAARRLTAVDIGVTSPAVAASGQMAMQSMVDRKNRERDEIRGELADQGIVYAPMVMSTFGEIHHDLNQWLIQLGKSTGRKRGWAGKAMERRIRARLGATLARGAARMSLATWGRGKGNADGEDADEEEDQDWGELAGGNPQGERDDVADDDRNDRTPAEGDALRDDAGHGV